MSLDLKHTEANSSPNWTDSRCLRVAQVPKSRDMAIFVFTTTTTTTTRPITLPPCACARGNYTTSQSRVSTYGENRALHTCVPLIFVRSLTWVIITILIGDTYTCVRGAHSR